MTDPATALADVRSRIAQAAKIAHRKAEEVTLIAVSKTHEAPAILPLIAAGQRVFGENRVQEAAAKWPALREAHGGIELHLVGQLQSNKADEAVALFDCIHSLDRPSLVAALAKAMDKAGRQVPCFVQVNIGGEEQKAGVSVDETVDFVRRCREVHGLDIVGLMCIPPDGQPAGPHFAHLVTLARKAGVKNLSMGMSGDFEVAIEEGSTLVRVGSALFGPRPRG